jgi:hypothetical protein
MSDGSESLAVSVLALAVTLAGAFVWTLLAWLWRG